MSVTGPWQNGDPAGGLPPSPSNAGTSDSFSPFSDTLVQAIRRDAPPDQGPSLATLGQRLYGDSMRSPARPPPRRPWLAVRLYGGTP